MLMRTDPFRELDRLSQQLWGSQGQGTWSRPSPMPIDAYRVGQEFVVQFDLPGVAPDAIELEVERNVLTVKAERRPSVLAGVGDGGSDGGGNQEVQVHLSERPLGVFSRQLFLGDTLDTDHIAADYDAGVLTLRIPVAEKAKPRKIEVTGGAETKSLTV